MKTDRFMLPAQNVCLEKLLTTEQVAAELQVAAKTVRALCSARAMSAVRICRRWRIPAAALEEFKRSHLSTRV
jgi:excisionase family DNA binding protein